MVQFVSYVLDDTQNTWTHLSPQQTGTPYRHAKLVLFRDYTQSECGGAASATGPFYCPEDEKVYIDLVFFDELSRRFGARGQFAQAYVLAHELGHHVQKLTGIEGKVHQLQESNSREAKPLSVKLELQADCRFDAKTLDFGFKAPLYQYTGTFQRQLNMAEGILPDDACYGVISNTVPKP